MTGSKEWKVKFKQLYDIKVTFLNPDVLGDAFRDAAKFGFYGMTYCNDDNDYDKNSAEYQNKWLRDFIQGKTFPRFALEQRLNFSIENVSRICLSQITRDRGFYCSESHGVRPLKQENMIPTSVLMDDSIMSKVEQAQYLLEEAYIECCEKNIPYPDSRYISLQGQTISFSASFSVGDFTRNCRSRTNNSFCDEANYVYRLMYHEVKKAIDNLLEVYNDSENYWFWTYLINDNNCIDDSYYTRTDVFNGDFNLQAGEYIRTTNPALCDFRKSAWYVDLQRLVREKPYLFTEKEINTIESWIKTPDSVISTYSPNRLEAAPNAIKNTDYYKKHKEDKDGK